MQTHTCEPPLCEPSKVKKRGGWGCNTQFITSICKTNFPIWYLFGCAASTNDNSRCVRERRGSCCEGALSLDARDALHIFTGPVV